MTAPDLVRSQYEALPYPPRDPAHELRELRATLAGQLKLATTIFWGGESRLTSSFRALDAGCGTGDSAIFMAEQLRDCGAQVIGIDLSEASLSIARQRAERRELTNVAFIRARIEDLPALGLEPFDYVVSLGVLHHLPDPTLGLRSIARVLKPSGGLGAMVYGEHGRMHIYQLQRLFQLIAPAALPVEQRLEIVKRTLNGLNPDHWASLGKASFAGEVKMHGDAGLFDLFLHSQDRAYTVPQIYDWLESAGMKLLRFDMPILYEPSANMPGFDAGALDERDRQAAAELLHGRIKKHTFFAASVESAIAEPPAWNDESAVPGWLMHDSSWVMEQVERRPQIEVFYEGIGFQCSLDGFRRDFLRLMDGRKTLGEVLDQLVARNAKLTRSHAIARWGSLFQALSLFSAVGMFRPSAAA
ncbi:MAG: class I SAM-dependent methyltransferase [Dehalococcoidia bacterium]